MVDSAMKQRALAVSIGLAFGASGGVARADAILFPVVQSGNGMSTYLQLANTATIANSAGVILNSSTSSSYVENLRFVYNYDTALTNDGAGDISINCTHIDLPGGTSDKDTMLFEATTGSGSTATQLLPASGSGYVADKSFAPILTGPIYGSLMVSNAWANYQPILTIGAGGVATGTWAGLSGSGANEGTLFGQAWVVDTVHGTLFGYNAINDPDEATTSAHFNDGTDDAFNYNMPDQYLFTWVPSYNNAVNTSYWMFPFSSGAAYGSTTPPNSVTMTVGSEAGNNNNSYNLVDTGQDGVWDHNESLISGSTTITITCGGVFMPLSSLMSAAHWNIVQYTGGLAYGDVQTTTSADPTGATFTRNRDAALVYKQIAVAGNGVISLVSEPGVNTMLTSVDTVVTQTATTAAAAAPKTPGSNIAVRSYNH